MIRALVCRRVPGARGDARRRAADAESERDLRRAAAGAGPAGGTVSVRVVRGSFASNLTNQPVEITVDGKTQTKKTDENGRVQLTVSSPAPRSAR